MEYTYSWEIDDLLKLRNNLLDHKEYLKVSDLNENPQIINIRYVINQDQEIFYMETTDNYKFKFKVKKLELK